MYQVLVNNELIEEGIVLRSPQALQTLADYVDTKIGTAHSRWMIAPGPWMPFSMVKLSPDNQNMGWQAGYQPTFETLGCFSHIHEWTMGGLGMMPTNGKLFTTVGDQFCPDEGYRSRIDKRTEEAPLGYYKVFLTDTKILAEVTATERASFQKYTFPKDKDGRVMIDLHIQAEYDYNLREVEMKQVSDYRIEGFCHQFSPQVWSGDADQEYVVNFVIEFDAPIKRSGTGLKTDNRKEFKRRRIICRIRYEKASRSPSPYWHLFGQHSQCLRKSAKRDKRQIWLGFQCSCTKPERCMERDSESSDHHIQ